MRRGKEKEGGMRGKGRRWEKGERRGRKEEKREKREKRKMSRRKKPSHRREVENIEGKRKWAKRGECKKKENRVERSETER